MDKGKVPKKNPVNSPRFLENGIITDRDEEVEKAEYTGDGGEARGAGAGG